MKNWEIMAVLESRQGDNESWACPALRPGNKRTRVCCPFKNNFSSARASSDRGKPSARPAAPRPAPPFPPRARAAAPSLSPVAPGDWPRLGRAGEWEGRRASSLIGPHAAAPVTWGATLRANFGWSAVARRADAFCYPRSESLEPANCCLTGDGS